MSRNTRSPIPTRPMHLAPGSARLLAALVMVALALPAIVPGTTAAATGPANVLFEASLSAPVKMIDGDRQAEHIVVADDAQRITGFAGTDVAERTWTPATRGTLTTFEPDVRSVAMADSGSVWAAAIAYESTEPGMLAGFSEWSDGPVWTFHLETPDEDDQTSSLLGTAEQPTVLAAGGDLFALGTTHGNVYLFRATADSDGGDKSFKRHYWRDNTGNAFGAITALAINADGDRILIGTEKNGGPTAHLFSDQFLMGSFANIQDDIKAIEISADGTSAAIVSGAGDISRVDHVDLQRGNSHWDLTMQGEVTAMALNETGARLAVGTDGGKLTIYERTGSLDDRDPVQTLHLGTAIGDLAFDDAGGSLALSTTSGELLFLSPGRSEPLWRHEAPGAIAGIAFGHDGGALVLATRETDAGRVIFTAADHTLDVLAPTDYEMAPGTQNTAKIIVVNSGNRMARVTADWGALPERWSGSGVPLILAPGETGTFRALLDVPSGEPAAKHTFSLTLLPFRAMSPDATQPTGAELDIIVRVAEVQGGIGSIAWSMPKAVPGGSPAAYLIKLENRGNMQDRVAIGYAHVPAGWKAAFDAPTELILNPGETRNMVYRVAAPPSAGVGQVAGIELILAWDHGEQRIAIETELVSQDAYLEALSLDQATTPAGADSSVDSARIGELAESLETEGGLTDVDIDDVETEDSPGPAMIAVLGMIIAVLAVARRRHD